MGEKSSKEYSVVFSMEGEKFNLGEKVQAIKFRRKVQICLVGSVRTQSAHRLSSELFAVVLTPNIAELVLFGFFCPQPWFLRRPEHILPGKHQHFHVDRQLLTNKEISIKINIQNSSKRSWPSGPISGFSRLRAGEGRKFFFFFSFIFIFF